MDEQDPMQINLWLCMDEIYTYDDYDNVYVRHDYGVCNPSRSDTIVFTALEEAKEEAISRTKMMFRLHAHHCFTMNTSFFRGDPEFTDMATDELKLVVSRFSRLSDLKEGSEFVQQAVDRIESILLDENDPDREMLVNIMGEVFYDFYTRVIQIEPKQISPKAREELYRLKAMKKDLETQIAALEERKRMMEVLY